MVVNASVVLLLEDEPLISMDLEMTLGSAGFDVTTLMSCTDAEDWLSNYRPDVAIVDVQLRDGSSDKVVAHLIEHGIPFVVHSGDHPSMHVDTPFAHGRWLNKPAAPEEIVQVARDLVAFKA